MKYFVFLFAVIAGNSAFAIEMKPGLWDVKVEIKINGAKFDPMEAMRAAMSMIPESQRTALEGKMKTKLPDDMGRVCLTKEDLKDPAELMKDSEENCKYKVTKNTSKEMSGTMVCEDLKGTFVASKKNDNLIVLNINGQREGQKYEMTSTSKFLSQDCGKLKR